jgi:hypothetical protein
MARHAQHCWPLSAVRTRLRSMLCRAAQAALTMHIAAVGLDCIRCTKVIIILKDLCLITYVAAKHIQIAGLVDKQHMHTYAYPNGSMARIAPHCWPVLAVRMLCMAAQGLFAQDRGLMKVEWLDMQRSKPVHVSPRTTATGVVKTCQEQVVGSSQKPLLLTRNGLYGSTCCTDDYCCALQVCVSLFSLCSAECLQCLLRCRLLPGCHHLCRARLLPFPLITQSSNAAAMPPEPTWFIDVCCACSLLLGCRT